MEAVVNSSVQPPIIVIEPEDAQDFYVTGGEIEAIDSQSVQSVFWVEHKHTNSRKIVLRMACPLSVALELNVKMQKAIAEVFHKIEQEREQDIPEREGL
jgi:hypothetical protein